MIGVNPLRTKVLITSDEVIFHAPTDENPGVRNLLQSIILAERRFIKPMLGVVIYNALIDNKNAIVTPGNKAILQAAVNADRADDREDIVLNTGDYVNSDTYLNTRQQELWVNYLHKIVAECVWFSALPVNRARFTAKGVVKNYPESIASTQESASIDLKDLKHLLDKGLNERISPLMDDMHDFLCQSGYPGYTRDCGCGDQSSVKKSSGVLFGLYDDDARGCCDEPKLVSIIGTSSSQNEIITFEDADQVIIPWNTNRRNQFGAGGAFTVEILGEDNVYRQVSVAIEPDDIYNTTLYTISLAGESTGRVIIG